VRNALSEAFTVAVEKETVQPASRVADFFLNDPLPVCVSDYIRQRLAAYAAVLAVLASKAVTDPLDIAMVIWDHHLFFETHEFLEPHWMVARGDEKRLLQAMIRAAGTYVHLEQGNLTAARRIAEKAIKGLLLSKDRLVRHTDLQGLLDKLITLDPVPPVLSGMAGTAKPSSGE
jgi:hypothetical protein